VLEQPDGGADGEQATEEPHIIVALATWDP
jgi:hypothetical protein